MVLGLGTPGTMAHANELTNQMRLNKHCRIYHLYSIYIRFYITFRVDDCRRCVLRAPSKNLRLTQIRK